MADVNVSTDDGSQLLAAPTSVTLPLPEIPPGLCSQVVRIDAEDDEIRRLMALGVCVGRKVELVQSGDPLIIRVLGSRIGVSDRLARRVWVETCIMPECQPH